MSKYYVCDKEGNDKLLGYLNQEKMQGFKIKPKNNVKYDGIEVSKLTLVEPSLIEMVLKRKTKKQLDAYLNFLIGIVDASDTDSGDLALVLDDIKRYQALIMSKYAKFLDTYYIRELLLRVKFVEDELKSKIKKYNQSMTNSHGRGGR